jgi:uncharacterized protein YjiS (DUF1127 family)
MIQATAEHARTRPAQTLAALIAWIARLRPGLDDSRRRARDADRAQYRRLLDGDPHLLADVGLARAEVLRALESLRSR